MLNLYQKAKMGLLNRKPPVPSRVQTFVTEGQLGFKTYHLVDSDGREVALNPINAAVAVLSLSALMKLNGDMA